MFEHLCSCLVANQIKGLQEAHRNVLFTHSTVNPLPYLLPLTKPVTDGIVNVHVCGTAAANTCADELCVTHVYVVSDMRNIHMYHNMQNK